MTTACLLVAGVLQCLTMTGAPPTPAEAAAILAPGQYRLSPASGVVGPTVTVVTATDGARTIPWSETYEGHRAQRLAQDAAIARLNLWTGWVAPYAVVDRRQPARPGRDGRR